MLIGNNFSFLTAVSDPDFALRAMADYADEKARAYADVVAAMTEAALCETPTELEAMLASYSFNPDSEVCINGAITTIRDAAMTIFQDSESEDLTSVDSDNVTIGGKSMSLSSFAESMQNDLYAVQSLAAAARAQLMGSFSDKMQYFSSRMEDIFQSARGTVSSTYQNYRDMLAADLDSQGFMDNVTEYIALDGLSEENDADTINAIADSPAKRYTGASPAGPLCFDTLTNAVASTVKIGVRVVKSVFKGIGKGFKKLFKWGKSKISRITTNPVDLEPVDGKLPYVENLNFQKRNISDKDTGGRWLESEGARLGAANHVQHRKIVQETFSKYVGQWITFQLHTGIFCICLTHVEANYSQAAEYPYDISYAYRWGFIPLMHPNVSYAAIFPNGANTTYQQVADALNDLSQQPDWDADKGDSENSLLKSLLTATSVSCTLVALAGYSSSLSDLNVQARSDVPEDWNVTGTVTNADFFTASTGQIISGASGVLQAGGSLNTSFASKFAVNDNRSYAIGITDACETLIHMFLTQRYYFQTNPISYTFLPYQNGKGIEPGSWRIKTDSTNKRAFNAFLTGAIVIAVAVVASVAVGLTVRSIKRKSAMKKLAKKSQLDSKMWNGETLTAQERKQYLKLNRKLNKSSVLSQGLSSSPGGDALQAFQSSQDVEILPYIIGPQEELVPSV